MSRGKLKLSCNTKQRKIETIHCKYQYAAFYFYMADNKKMKPKTTQDTEEYIHRKKQYDAWY